MTAAAHRLGPVTAVPLGEGRAYRAGDAQVAVFRLRDGSLRALDARCPHAGGPLADGQTDLARVVCPLHARAWSFADGSCPEGGSVAVFAVRDEGGEIVLETPAR